MMVGPCKLNQFSFQGHFSLWPPLFSSISIQQTKYNNIMISLHQQNFKLQLFLYQYHSAIMHFTHLIKRHRQMTPGLNKFSCIFYLHTHTSTICTYIINSIVCGIPFHSLILYIVKFSQVPFTLLTFLFPARQAGNLLVSALLNTTDTVR